MAQNSIDFKLKIGPTSTADGTGSSSTDLTTNDSIFKQEDADTTRGITIGGTTSGVDTFTSATKVTLTQAVSWSDGDTVKLDEKEVGSQQSVTFNTDSDVIDTTTKDDNQIRSILPSIRNATVDMSSLYVHDDNALVDIIQAIQEGYTVDLTVANGSSNNDDRAGEGLLTSLEVGANYTDASTVSCSLQLTGGFTIS